MVTKPILGSLILVFIMKLISLLISIASFFILSTCTADLLCYLEEDAAVEEIPALRMLTMPQSDLRRRARRLARRLKKQPLDAEITVVPEQSRVGGGALPLQTIPTWAIAIKPLKASVEALETELRGWHPPIIARIADDRVVMDLRTIRDDDLPTLAEGVQQTLARINA